MRSRRWIPVAVLAALAWWSLPLAAQVKEEDRRFKLAQGYEMSGDLKSAARVYKELYDLDPRSNAYFEGVRRTYMAMLRYADLLPIVEERLSTDGDDVDLRTLHADLLSRNRRRDEALAEWSRAIRLRPKDERTYLGVAQSQVENRLFDEAAATYMKGRSELGEPTVFGDQLGQIYAVLGRFEDAAREYVGMLAQNPSKLNYVMGDFGLFTSNPAGADAAIRVVRKASADRPDYLPYLDLLEWLYTEKADYSGSFDVARRLDELRNAHGSNIFAFTDRALRDGNVDAAITGAEYFLKTFPKDNPLYPNILVSYARALQQRFRDNGGTDRGEADKLVERYEELATGFRGTPAAAEALLELARLQADDLDEPKDALATLVRLRTEHPKFVGLPEATLMEGELNLRLGQLARAQEIFKAGASAPASNNPDARHFHDLCALRYAETLFYTGAFQNAVDSLTALTQNTGSDATNDALQYLFILQENFGKNDEALKHYAAGRLKLVEHNWDDAIDEMRKVVAVGAQNPLADEALMARGEAEEGEEKWSDAISTMLDLVKNYHDGTIADRALFRAAELTETKLHDNAKALELYTRVLTEYPESPTLVQARQRIRVLRGNS